MPVQVDWDDDEHTTLHLEFHRPWTWEEFFEAAAQMKALIQAKPYTVYTISDTRDAGAFPIGSITQIRRAMGNVAPNTGGVVGVGVTTPIRVLADLFQHMNISIARKFVTAASMEAAREIIAGWKAEKRSDSVR